MQLFRWLSRSIYRILGFYAAVILISGGVYSLAEVKPFIDGVWWAVVTATTVGYGDFYPVTAVGRVCAAILAHVAIFLVAPLIVSHILNLLIEDRDKFRHEEQEEIINRLRDMDQALEIIGHKLGVGKEISVALDTENCEVTDDGRS